MVKQIKINKHDQIISLGLTTGIHDTSASIVINGKITAASEEDRFDRDKHSGSFPFHAIKYCIEKSHIKNINEIDEVCIGMDWMERGKNRFIMRYDKKDTQLTKQSVLQVLNDIERTEKVEKVFREELGYLGKIKFYNHSLCHASVCYYPSPFLSAVILIIDGCGEKASTTIFSAKDNNFNKLFQINYPHSIGRFYGWMTDYLGFKMDSDEGKVMGLAAFGDESLIKKMREVLIVKNNGTYQLDLSYFEFQKDNSKGVSKKFIEVFGPKRYKKEEITIRHKNIAKAVQAVTEEAILALSKLAKKLSNEENLCLGGGVILNSVANGKILKSSIFKQIYIYPAAGDNGAGLGAALFSHFSKAKKKTFYEENQNPYLGYESNDNEILNTIKKYCLNYYKPKNTSKEIARLLSENMIIGHYNGQMEFGPRGLGNRSIFADPRKSENKNLVNSKIKFRESFRPFAPTVLEEFANEYFEMCNVDSPYMIVTFKTRIDKISLIPSVVHVDGTARVHTITKEQNERFYDIINEFNNITGIPMLLNTSFNKAGEVVVTTPEQAIETFVSSGLDVLVLGNFIIKK